MSLTEKIASLLVPEYRCKGGAGPILAGIRKAAPGGVFLYPDSSADFRATALTLKSELRTVPLILSDLEDNEYFADKPYLDVPDLMCLSATGNPALAFRMGEAVGAEFRSLGIDWALGPNFDINANRNNPITNTRSFGDRAATVRRFGMSFARGLQAGGILATAKHFPGDGLDDRDQHLATSSNEMGIARWRRSFGNLYRLIGSLPLPAVMMGHISLPDYPAPRGEDRAWPSCIRKSVISGLLRRECGFKGLVISDAVDMGGVLAWGGREEMLIRMVNAGVDMLLFSRYEEDLETLARAVKVGLIDRGRIDEAALRVAALKARSASRPGLTGAAGKPHRPGEGALLRKQVAEASLSLVHVGKGPVVGPPVPAGRVLSISVTNIPHLHTRRLDSLLRRGGWSVKGIRLKPDSAPEPIADLSSFDCIIVSAIIRPSWGTNDIRINRHNARFLWMSLLGKRRPPVFFLSFGSPYLYRDYLFADACCNAYSPSPFVQEAVYAWLSGRISARGRSPVKLDWSAHPPKPRGNG